MSRTKRELLAVLSTWKVFIKELKNCDLQECKRLLDLEISGHNRFSFIDRIAGRVVKLESQNMRNEIYSRSLQEEEKRNAN